MAKKPVKHTMDRKLVSLQPWEVSWIINKLSCTKDDIIAGIKAVGRGRRKLYKWIRNAK